DAERRFARVLARQDVGARAVFLRRQAVLRGLRRVVEVAVLELGALEHAAVADAGVVREALVGRALPLTSIVDPDAAHSQALLLIERWAAAVRGGAASAVVTARDGRRCSNERRRRCGDEGLQQGPATRTARRGQEAVVLHSAFWTFVAGAGTCLR